MMDIRGCEMTAVVKKVTYPPNLVTVSKGVLRVMSQNPQTEIKSIRLVIPAGITITHDTDGFHVIGLDNAVSQFEAAIQHYVGGIFAVV